MLFRNTHTYVSANKIGALSMNKEGCCREKGERERNSKQGEGEQGNDTRK